MLNEIYLNMYRVAVNSGRLSIEFIPEPYRAAIKEEQETATVE
jgi:hypothetical protein